MMVGSSNIAISSNDKIQSSIAGITTQTGKFGIKESPSSNPFARTHMTFKSEVDNKT